MKLTVRKDETLDNDYIDIQYRELTPAICKILEICDAAYPVLLCEKDGATHRVDANDVLYIEWVDSKCCVYTKDEVFIIATPLSQLEEALQSLYFVRIGKSTLVNICKIKSISTGLHYRLTAELVNGEKIIISRHYRGALLDAINALAKEVSA